MKIAAVLVSVVVGTFSACDDPEPFFKECPLSSTILTLCEEQSTDTELTCIVREHPMCTEQVCAAWEGSRGFCSRECTGDGDCPAESTCQTYLEFSVCVPNELPPPLADESTVQ